MQPYQAGTDRASHALSRQKNSFDSLRLFGALIVMVGHAFIITGRAAPMIGTIPIHSFGVCIFFSVSGFLITQSWMSDPKWCRYISRRLLRIIPALVVVSATSAILIGALATTESLATYFRHGWTWRYIVSNSVLVTVWGLPGVFNDLPIHGQANGSLWTLPIEFLLYLVVPVIVCARAKLGILAVLGITVLAAATILFCQLHPGISAWDVYGIDYGNGLALAPYFWVGAALRLIGFERIDRRLRTRILFVSGIAVLCWAVSAIHLLLPLAMIVIVVLVLATGLTDWLYSRSLEKLGDLSYGTYLWAFPIQQFTMEKTHSGVAMNLAVAAPITLLLAFLSWRLIERQALRFKPSRRIYATQEHAPVRSAEALQSPSTSALKT